MTNVYIYLPYYDRIEGVEKARSRIFVTSDTLQKLEKAYGKENVHVKPITCGGNENIIIPKGLTIRSRLYSDIEEISKEEDTIVCLIDGTGKIDYAAINTVVEQFTQNEKIVFVFGSRKGQTNWGISEERKQIECFENYLISKKHQGNITKLAFNFKAWEKYENDYILPDGQCGCWGFQGKVIKDLLPVLTASSYEIECDLLITCLEKEWKFKFIDVKMANYTTLNTTYKKLWNTIKKVVNGLPLKKEDIPISREEAGFILREFSNLLIPLKQSNFVYKDNLTKLHYLSLRLGLGWKGIEDSYKKYTDTLPGDYKNAVSALLKHS